MEDRVRFISVASTVSSQGK